MLLLKLGFYLLRCLHRSVFGYVLFVSHPRESSRCFKLNGIAARRQRTEFLTIITLLPTNGQTRLLSLSRTWHRSPFCSCNTLPTSKLRATAVGSIQRIVRSGLYFFLSTETVQQTSAKRIVKTVARNSAPSPSASDSCKNLSNNLSTERLYTTLDFLPVGFSISSLFFCSVILVIENRLEGCI